MGFYDVEVATAEVKQNDANWKRWFFEAASHTRLAERSYFIFAAFDRDFELDDEFYIYSEKFRVGVAVIELDWSQKQQLKDWSKLEKSAQLQLVDQVNERIPAPFSPMSIREKADFLQQIGINQKDDLHGWGDE